MTVNNGHGSTQSFAQGDIFPRENIPNLSNDQRLPAMVMMTLPHTHFAMLDGSRFLTDETHLSDGAVAAFASMGSDFNFEFSSLFECFPLHRGLQQLDTFIKV